MSYDASDNFVVMYLLSLVHGVYFGVHIVQFWAIVADVLDKRLAPIGMGLLVSQRDFFLMFSMYFTGKILGHDPNQTDMTNVTMILAVQVAIGLGAMLVLVVSDIKGSKSVSKDGIHATLIDQSEKEHEGTEMVT